MQSDRYIPGVPCWVEGVHPDPAAAADFYSQLFGWECERTVSPESGDTYIIGRIRGEDVAALGSASPGGSTTAGWITYVWVASADETSAAAVAAGGTVVTEPVEVADAGRMAMLADPEGAVFGLWEPNQHRGASAVNEPGSVVFNDLHTRDVHRAADFYSKVFGWEVVDIGGAPMWALPGYGAFLDTINPGTVASTIEAGAPAAFVNVVASVAPIPTDDADTPAHWGVTFGVSDADLAAKHAVELGGRVLVGPTDAPWVRFAVIADPQGAVFTASQYKPENAA
jgi:uncharacterized protein